MAISEFQKPGKRPRRRRTHTMLQMEATECGAAALGSVLGYYGKYVPLEQLRTECGVSRDGSKLSNVVKAARKHGLTAKGFRKEPDQLYDLQMPAIVFWNFNHFVVLEGFGKGVVFLNDPASGSRKISDEEFDQGFTGVVLTLEPDEAFQPGGRPSRMISGLRDRLITNREALTLAVLTGLMLVIPGLAVPTFLRVFIDDVLIARRESWVIPLLIAMFVATVAQSGLTWLQSSTLLKLEAKISLVGSTHFFWHVLRLPMEFFNQRWPGDIAHRVAVNNRVASLLSGELATASISIVSMVFFAVVMFYHDVVLTCIAISMAAINGLALRFVASYRSAESQKIERSRGLVAAAEAGGLQGIETIKSTGTESEFFTHWSGSHARSINAEQGLAVSTAIVSAVPQMLDGLSRVFIIAIGGLRVMEGALTVGMLLAFQSLMARFMGPTQQLVFLTGEVQELEAGMKRLDDVLRYPTDSRVTATETDLRSTESVKLSGHLEVNAMTFGYSRLEQPLIQQFSLKVEPGARIALVGGSGSGKSTIARIIAGLFLPWEGDVLLDGQSRSTLPPSIVTNSLTMVDQDIFLFAGTFSDNLSMWDSTMSHTDVVRAAKDACIHDDIMQRKNGYDGEVIEGGGNLSGGQRQRLEIARALAVNPTILILDEATSALDVTTEQMLDNNLRRRGCTCIIVAHRLSTVRDCDEIIVLDHGEVVQRGSHDILKEDSEGVYARLIAV
ncbi:uncharacterized protein METZ01_LOCUS124045 [marine metagenome]|uniref:NHLP family bacteriocin export ABC transporter peptidase/permease/ATPase subunit n=1 Tax=marine metagenome TaxID=408172 RepID=A0A381Y3E5_9ZZZZ